MSVADSMSFEQRKRMDKMMSERHFLLDLSKDMVNDKQTNFSVSGSTGNVYKLALDLNQFTLSCDCPDFTRNAARHKVLCKHSCFIVRRVLRQANDGPLCYIHPRRFLLHNMRSSIEQRVELLLGRSFEHECGDLVNKEYLQRYRESTDTATNTTNKKRKISEQSQDQADMENFGIGKHSDWSNDKEAVEKLSTDDCPVCFEQFSENKSNEFLVRCGTCHNFTHKNCLDKWLQRGTNDNCIFCRADLPYVWYKSQDKRAAFLAKKEMAEREYLNVADKVEQ